MSKILLHIQSRQVSAGLEGEAFPRCTVPWEYNKELNQKDRAAIIELQKVLLTIWEDHVPIDLRKATVYCIEPSLATRQWKESVCTCLFDIFEIERLEFVLDSIATLASQGSQSGLVVNIDDEATTVCPVAYGVPVIQGLKLSHVGMSKVRSRAEKLLVSENFEDAADLAYSITETGLRALDKSKTKFFIQDVQDLHTIYKPAENETLSPLSFRKKDGTTVQGVPQYIVFASTEALFEGKDVSCTDTDELCVARLITTAVSECGIDIRRLMLENIVLTGSSWRIAGLCERLEAEISTCVPASTKPSVNLAPLHAEFQGLSHLASLGLQSRCSLSLHDWTLQHKKQMPDWLLLS